MKKLVLFIHGLGGSAEGTWKKFPELMGADTKVTEVYDVETFEYSTGAFGSKPSLPKVAAILKTEIDNRYASYSDIALIAHSQGGLVAKHYIAERLNSGQPLRVSRLATFSTPHQGSGGASLLKWMPFASQQTKDLAPNSDFLQALAVAWGQAKPKLHGVLTKFTEAANDAIVGQVSAMGPWSPGYEVVGGDGHIAVVKPKTADHTSFLIAKKFLLEDSLRPGGVEPDYQTPLLRLELINAKDNDSARFLYSAQVLPLIGRDAEIGILKDFLGGPEQPFRWMVLYGSGGVGKSRLALELCLAVRSEWHAGFLSQKGNEPDWGRWQPRMPTLIVIDPAAKDTERTGQLLQALAGRGPTEGTARLAAPVRVLLVERTGEGEWLKTIMGDETKKAQLVLVRADDVPLKTIRDPWPIFEFFLKEKNKPLPDKTETLAALAQIDPESRPLFAYFIADAIARGVAIRNFDAARLLDDVIEHGRKAYWKPAGATAEDERLLAVATMAGGVPIGALDDVTEKLLPSWNIDRHPAIFLAMTGRDLGANIDRHPIFLKATGLDSGANIAPLEPDIVGEHFVLVSLRQKNLSVANRARLCGLAWRFNPLGMMQFMLRAHRDLPTDDMLKWVRKSPASEGESQLFWAMAAVELMIDLRSRDPDGAWKLLRDMRGVAALADEYWEQLEVKWTKDALWELWAKAGAVSIGADLTSLLQNSVLAGPTQNQTESSAKKDFFYQNLLVSRDPDAAQALLDDMRSVAEARGETSLWKTWTYAVLAMMDELVSRDPVSAWALLKEVLSVTESRHDEDLEWFAMVGTIAAAGVETWLNKMRDVAATRGDASLWEQWAKALSDLINTAQSHDTARALLDELRVVAAERNQPIIWEAWAKAARNRILVLPYDPLVPYDPNARCDPDAALALLADMHTVADKRGEPALWEQWTKAASYLVIGLQLRDPNAVSALSDELSALPPDFIKWVLSPLDF